MTIVRFEEICEEFCRLARIPSVAPAADAANILAFHVDWRGVTTTVIYAPENARNHAVVLIELGPVDGQSVDPATIMRALLFTNFFPWRGDHSPCFACHPETGDAILQCSYPILDAAPETLFTLIDEGVALALKWREDFLLPA